MGEPGKTIHIRLPVDLQTKFEHLHAHYKGLASSHLLRMLLADQLGKPLDEQSDIIQKQIRGESGPEPTNRLPSLNRKKQH